MYYPGFTGTFYLDDFHTLEPLAALGGVGSFDEAIYYVFSGRAGPTGRPFSLLTFLVNSRSWPVEAYWFLATNVAIHALNAILIFWVLKELLNQAGFDDGKSLLVAVIVAFIWVVHPYHVSTVLYTVQRMTLLSSFFTLLILLTYLRLRAHIQTGSVKKILLCVLAGSVFSVLGLLSKETIIVVPLQILVIDRFLKLTNPSIRDDVVLNKWLFGVVGVAGLIVFLYPIKILIEFYLSDLLGTLAPSAHRDFTPIERFLSQQHVLLGYIYETVLPKFQGAGVFYDGYQVSKSLIDPISTLFRLGFHCIAIALAFAVRKKFPVIFLCVLWFYGSLYLESTFVMLELKFEHRNYLPSLGIIGLLVLGISKISSTKLKMISAVGYAVVLVGFLFARTNLWGNPIQAAGVWAQNNPHSSRALENAARQSVLNGYDIEAAKQYLKKAADISNTSAMKIKYIAASCEDMSNTAIDWDAISRQLTSDPPDGSLHTTLENLLKAIINGSCNAISSDQYIQLLDAYRENKYYTDKLGPFYMDEYQVRLLLSENKYEEAEKFELSTLSKIIPLALAIRRAGYIATLGYPALAEKSLRVRLALAKQVDGDSSFEYQQASEVYMMIKKEVAGGGPESGE